MDILIIEPTRTSPYICCDPNGGLYTIQGQSFPEDPMELYHPLIIWLEQNIKNISTPINFILKTEYFNSASNRILLKILRILELHAQTGKSIEIIWCYADEDSQNDGVIFQRLLNMPFNLVFEPK